MHATERPTDQTIPNHHNQAGGYLELQFVRVNIGQGITRPRVGIFRDRKTQATTESAAAGDDGEEYEDVWREMTEEDLAALSPEERKARKLQLGGQGAEAQPLEVCLLWR